MGSYISDKVSKMDQGELRSKNTDPGKTFKSVTETMDCPMVRELFVRAFPDLDYRSEARLAWFKDWGEIGRSVKKSRAFKVTCETWMKEALKFLTVSQGSVTIPLICEKLKNGISFDEDGRLTRHQLMEIIDFLPDATFVIDRNRKVIAWNRAIEEMTGIRKQEIMGIGDYAYGVPFYGEPRPILIDLIYDDRPSIESQYRYVVKKGETLYAEAAAPFLLSGQRTYIWATASPLRDEGGEIIGAIESIRDITERIEAEDALKDSERRLADIINFLPDPTFVIDKQGTIIAWNRSIEAMTEVEAEQILGEGVFEHALPFYGKRRPMLADLVLKHNNEFFF